MSKTALLKLFGAVVITFILVLPEHFKTPKGRTLELSCFEVCVQSTFTSPLSFAFTPVTILQPARETQTILGIFPNHSSFQSFTKICQDTKSEFKMCSSCLVCELKGDMDFMSQEQASKGLIMKGSMGARTNDVYSPCQHFNFTVTLIVGTVEEYNCTWAPKPHPSESAISGEDLTSGKSANHTCRIMEHLNNCSHISLLLEMDVKSITCSVKITWYILVLLVVMFLIILVIYQVLEGHRQMQKWQSHKYQAASAPLRGSDSETLNVGVISGDLSERNRKEIMSPVRAVFKAALCNDGLRLRSECEDECASVSPGSAGT